MGARNATPTTPFHPHGLGCFRAPLTRTHLHPARCPCFLLRPGGSIGNFVWLDLNGNGVQDTGEPGLEGVTVLLLSANGTVLQTTTTDANGQYVFSGLPAGSYQLAFVPPAGSTYTASPSGQGADPTRDSDISPSGTTGIITLSPGESRSDVDAGFSPGACVCASRRGGVACLVGTGGSGKQAGDDKGSAVGFNWRAAGLFCPWGVGKPM